MARKKKRPFQDRFRCDQIEGERFYATNDDVFRFNWWEIFCFPYILCHRLWDCFISLCAGTNQCLIYWMGIQWIICKITRMSTPDPIVFPYFFYMFCQVILLTLFFIYIWYLLGSSYIIPYIKEYYRQLEGIEDDDKDELNVTRLTFRKYCFKKSELFSAPYDSGQINSYNFLIVSLSVLVGGLYKVIIGSIYFKNIK